MLIKDVKYTYNDVEIVPAVLTKVEHREECCPYDKDGYLPIFASPMSTVVSMENFDILEENKIHAIIPRNIDIDIRIKEMNNGKWVAFSLTEFIEHFNDKNHIHKNEIKVLIDIANGHMESLYKAIRTAKDLHPKICIMMGNIANPGAYKVAFDCHVDYVRIGIGNGEGCISSTQLGVNYPMASLIDEIANIRCEILSKTGCSKKDMPKIIADGGIKSYADINKALGLGADYVMIGGLFASLLESPAETINKETQEVIPNSTILKRFYINDNNEIIDKQHPTTPLQLQKKFYGMASISGSKDLGKSEPIAPEGCVKLLDVNTDTKKWAEMYTHYLQSAMSYENAFNLGQFKPNMIVVSPSAHNAVNRKFKLN